MCVCSWVGVRVKGLRDMKSSGSEAPPLAQITTVRRDMEGSPYGSLRQCGRLRSLTVLLWSFPFPLPLCTTRGSLPREGHPRVERRRAGGFDTYLLLYLLC